MALTTLFVYGTLKRGCRRHSLLADQQFLGLARTVPRYRLYRRDAFPCLVEDDQGVAIRGELWQIDAAALARIDEYEGAPELFRRLPIALETQATQAHAYFYNGDITGLPDGGCEWVDY